jgi:hypothetical protein
MNTKIVAGPLGFHAYCAPDVFAPSVSLWEQIHNYIGPLRESQAEAEQDLRAMIAATTVVVPEAEKLGRFTKMSDKSIQVLYGNAKARRKGLRPFFRDPRNMIALRMEFERRFK